MALLDELVDSNMETDKLPHASNPDSRWCILQFCNFILLQCPLESGKQLCWECQVYLLLERSQSQSYQLISEHANACTCKLLACRCPLMNLVSSCREVAAAFIPGRTKLLMLETPTNPKLDVCDIRGCCEIAKKVTHPLPQSS